MMKKILLVATVGLLVSVVSFTDSYSTTPTDWTTPTDSLNSLGCENLSSTFLADNLIGFAKEHLGIRYRYGGITRKGFDCSGFTHYIFSHFGFQIPHSSASQAHFGEVIEKSNIEKGDLIFFKGRNSRSKSIGHVGIVISEKGEPIRFIHASSNQGITIETIQSRYYSIRFLKSIRLIDRTLPVPESACKVNALIWTEL